MTDDKSTFDRTSRPPIGPHGIYVTYKSYNFYKSYMTHETHLTHYRPARRIPTYNSVGSGSEMML
jgi:hypothetical protein